MGTPLATVWTFDAHATLGSHPGLRPLADRLCGSAGKSGRPAKRPAPTEGAWGVSLEVGYFGLIREAGFDSVRIPVRWSAHAATSPPYRIDPYFFARIDWAVAPLGVYDRTQAAWNKLLLDALIPDQS